MATKTATTSPRKARGVLIIGGLGLATIGIIAATRKAAAAPGAPPEGPAPTPDVFVYSSPQCGMRPAAVAPAWMEPTFNCVIKNTGEAGVRTVTFVFQSYNTRTGAQYTPYTESFELNLGSGSSYTYIFDNNRPGPGGYIKIAFGHETRILMHLQDNKGGKSPECSQIYA